MDSKDADEGDFEKVWNEVGRLVGGDANTQVLDSAQSKAEQEQNRVEAAWQKVVAEGGQGQLFPTEHQGVLRLLQWAATNLGSAISGIRDVTEVALDSKIQTLAFRTERTNGRKGEPTTVFLANDVKYGPDLKRRLEHIARKKAAGRKVLLRTSDTFPAKRTKAYPVLEQLAAQGFEKIEMEDKELMALARYRRLDDLVLKPEFDQWMADQLLSLPSLTRMLNS